MSYKRGSDKSQVEDCQEQEEVQSYIAAGAVADDICKALLKRGYKLLAAQDGAHCCHNIYITKRLEANPDVKYWAQIAQDLEWQGFNVALESTVNELSGNGSQWLSIARKLQTNLTTQASDKQSLMYGVGFNKSRYADPNVPRSFTGKLVHKQIPSVSWFPKLANLDPYELLTLFPRPEATALMLMLGRAMLGVDGTVTQEGIINHKMRAAAIIVGAEPALGKSTLLNGFITAAKQLGYTSEPIATAGSRFGWGKIAASDIAYKDDLNRETQTAILKSETLKTIITGGSFSSERKGLDSETTKSNATIFSCSNDYNVYDFYKMDEGSISRFNFLYTYNKAELTELFPNHDGRTGQNIERLAKQYMVTENQLYTYLLACSVRLLMETLGYAVVNDSIVRVGEDKAQEVFEGLRKKFTYSPAVTHVRDLINSTAHLIAFALGTKRSKKARIVACDKLANIGFDYEILYCMLSQYANGVSYGEVNLKGLMPSCRSSIKLRLEELSNRSGNRNASQAFEFMIAELISTHGATFPKGQGAYYSLWSEAKKAIPALADNYATLMSQEDDKGDTAIDSDSLESTTRNNIAKILDLLDRSS